MRDLFRLWRAHRHEGPSALPQPHRQQALVHTMLINSVGHARGIRMYARAGMRLSWLGNC